jgi:hypothetical protein
LLGLLIYSASHLGGFHHHVALHGSDGSTSVHTDLHGAEGLFDLVDGSIDEPREKVASVQPGKLFALLKMAHLEHGQRHGAAGALFAFPTMPNLGVSRHSPTGDGNRDSSSEAAADDARVPAVTHYPLRTSRQPRPVVQTKHIPSDPTIPWKPAPQRKDSKATTVVADVAQLMRAIHSGPPIQNKNAPGSSKNHPINPWTKTVEHELTAPKIERAKEPFIGPRKVLLVCLFTGGDPGKRTATDQTDRVTAIDSTWADIDVRWVTNRNDIDASRRITLPEEAETGGYKKIWKKSLHLFHYLANSDLGAQYDFVLKGDDDTYVNLPELRKVLQAFDPSVPAQFGNNLYGVACRGPAPTSPFYWQNRGINSCHGGAGYVISRGALELTADRWLDCATQWPGSGYEDGTVAYCLMRNAATECFGMKSHFGWDRYHNTKREQVGNKLDLLESNPIMYGSATTFHPVPPQFQSRVYNSISQYRKENSAAIDRQRESVLQKSHKFLVGQWNCTLTPPSTRGKIGSLKTGSQVALAAIRKPTPGLIAINGLCQQYGLRAPPLAGIVRSTKTAAFEAAFMLLRETPSTAGKNAAAAAALLLAPVDAVILILDPRLTEASVLPQPRSAALLALSLQAVNSMARLIIIAGKEHQHVSAAALKAGASGARVELVLLSDDIFLDEGLPGYGGLAVIVAAFLDSRAGNYDRIVLLAGPDVVFQRDPFSDIPLHQNGLALFVTDSYPAKLADYDPDISITLKWMGVCSARDMRLLETAAKMAEADTPGNHPTGLDTFRGAALIDLATIVGSSSSVRIALGELIHEYSQVKPEYRSVCGPSQSFSRLVWSKGIAERTPLSVADTRSSPVLRLNAGDRNLWSIQNGTVQNLAQTRASIVLTPKHCVCCSASDAKRFNDLAAPSSIVSVCLAAAMPFIEQLRQFGYD